VAAMPDEDLRSEAQRKQQSAARNEGLQASLLSSFGFVAPITLVPHSLACRRQLVFIEGSLEVKLPTIWIDEKQSRAEAERRERSEERRVEEKE